MRRRAILAAGAGLALAAGWFWMSGLAGLGLLALATRGAAPEWQDRGLWLPGYTAGIEARPIAGLADNVSGLTYHPGTGHLLTVINRPPAVAELSATGDLLRLIPLTGADDPEGITHIDGDLFVVADEGTQRLSWVTITPDTTALTLTGAPGLTLAFGHQDNMGFEGVSWDQTTRRLYVAQEMWPVRVLVIEGLDRALAAAGLDVTVREWVPRQTPGHFAADLSSLSLHDATGNLLLLSHLTAALVEYAPDGQPVSLMPLWAGWHGLTRGIPQAEGLAIGPAGEIFLVSEPNLFYRFDRGRPAPWAAES